MLCFPDSKLENPENGMTPAERQMIILTGIIALATIANVAVFYFESEDASKQTAALASKAGEIVGSMNTALANNRDALSKAFDANRDALKASETQSRASLNASIDISRNDQRSWIVVNALELAAPPIVGGRVHVNMAMINSGKTPGMKIVGGSLIVSRPDITTLNFSDTFQTANPPIAVLAGGETYTAKIESQATIASQAQIEAIAQGTTRLFARGVIRYEDVFMRPHSTHFCGVMSGPQVRTAGARFSFCERGNDIN